MSDYINPNLDNGREHRVGADLYDWNYNNTYNIDTVVDDIKTFIDQLYTHSLYTQEVLCDISRLCGSMADFRRDINVNDELGIGYFSYTLEIPIKNVPCFKTLALKRANPRIYTIFDSCNLTDLFERRVMFFVNGQYFHGIKFYADTNRFILIIEVDTDPEKYETTMAGDVIRNDRLKNMIKNGDSWSILLMPFSNTKYIIDYPINIIKGRKLVLSRDKTKDVSNVKFVDSNTWLVSVSDIKEKSNTVSTIANASIENGELVLDLPVEFANSIRKINMIAANVVAMPNVSGLANLYLARAFQIQFLPSEKMTNPIPPQDIICFETDENGSFVKYLHNATIKMYYPNIYKIEDVDPSKYIMIMWMYSSQDTTIFINPLDLYMKYDSDYATEAINNKLPVTIKNYIPMVNTYRERSYLEYFVRATRRNEFSYKFEYLKELIRDDTSRLEKIYTDMVTNTAYKWHSNPRYYIDMKNWGNIENRKRYNSANEVTTFAVTEFGTECIYFVIEHEDEREYPIAVWIDGVRCTHTWLFTERYRSYLYIPTQMINSSSHIEFEILKVRSKKATVVDMKLPKIHNSIQIPKEFKDISPQNLMISRRMETSDSTEDGGLQYIYKIAPDYEMYWLIFGNTEYKDGVPVNYSRAENQHTSDIIDVTSSDNNEHYDLDDTNNEVLSLTTGSKWVGGSSDYLMENGYENYITAPSSEFPDDYTDYLHVKDLGYYKDDRRRFYEYLPNGKDNNPIFITPITDYFAEKHVRIQNTDIYWSKKFTITQSDKRFKLTKYVDEPIRDRWRIYLNGKLLIPNEDYHVDANVKNGFYINNIVSFVVLKEFEGETAEIFFEYIPYKYGHLYSVYNVNDSYMMIRDAIMTRPFSLVYYDMYIDGVKVRPDEVEVITPTKIHILRPLNNSKVAFFERRHDSDIYDNEKVMQKSLVDYVAEEDKGFRNYLLSGK